MGLQISAREIFERLTVDILSVIAVFHILDEYGRSFHDIPSGSHEHSLDIGLHGFEDYEHLARIVFRSLRDKKILGGHELTAILSHEPGILDERIIFGDLIDDFDGALGRLLDIFDIGRAYRHIVFIVDISGIIRDIEISGILFVLGIRKRIVTEIVDDALHLTGRNDIDAGAREDERIQEIEDHQHEKHFESEYHIEDIILLGIDLKMELFNIEEKIIDQSQIFDDLVLFLMQDSES